jgi:hypothetical protein
MADRGKLHNEIKGTDLIHQIEMSALRTLTPVNPSNSLQLKSQVIRRIREGFYDQRKILDCIAERIEPLYCERRK